MLTSMLQESKITVSAPPAAVEHRGDARLNIAGKDVTRAGGVSVALDAELLQLRQTCAEACDGIVVSFGPQGGLYKVQVLDQRGECVLCQDVYFEGHNDDRVALGADGRLTLDVGLVGY